MIEKKTIEGMLRELASGDGARTFMSLLGEETTWVIAGSSPWSRRYRGKAIINDLLRPLFSHIEGRYRFHAERYLVDGELLAIEGRGDNLLKDGRRYDNSYIWLLQFSGPRLLELREYMDTNLVLSLFGPPPA